eukprot:XP_011667700.1 PREDICTED: uncharacterized protein LOC105439877 [Strongylocentrotus purpuratus]
MTGIPEAILNRIGEAVGTDSNTVINLGISLTFPMTVIRGYLTSNQSENVSPTGTKKMLFDWKKKTRPQEQKVKLRKALIKVQLLEIADNYLPEGDQKLRCLKCDRILAKITDTISKQSENAKSSKVRYILGVKCLVQLMTAEIKATGEEFRHDVITMTTADVKLVEELTFKALDTHLPNLFA